MAKQKNRRFETRQYNEREFNMTTKKLVTYLRGLSNRRNDGTVTSDDVHAYLNRDGVRPEQIRTRLSFIKSVLREPMFEQVDVVASARPAAKGRAISAWAAV